MINMWDIFNESPKGYEPAFSVINTENGREISSNLELDEAIKVKYSNEIYDILKSFNNGIADKLYITSKADKEFLKNANEIITKMEELYHRINRDYKKTYKDL